MGWGELHCHHQNDFCIKMGSDENHFNVSVGSDGRQSHKTVSTNHNLFEERGEPKRYRSEVLRLPAERLTARPNRLTLQSMKLCCFTSTETVAIHDDDDVGLHVLGCRVDRLQSMCETPFLY